MRNDSTFCKPVLDQRMALQFMRLATTFLLPAPTRPERSMFSVAAPRYNGDMRPVSQKPAAAPPQPSDGKPSRIVAATVESCRRRMAFQDLLARLIGLTAAAVLFPLLVVIVDHLWPDGLPQRIVAGAAVGWAVVVVLAPLVLVVQAGRRRINPLFAAQQVERARGIRHNTLVKCE